MSDDKRELVRYGEVLPPAQQQPSYPAPQMPSLPSTGGWLARRELEKGSLYMQASSNYLTAKATQIRSYTSLVSATAEAERALYALDRLPEILEEEWQDGRSMRRRERELLEHDHQVALHQRDYTLTQSQLATAALERDHERDMQLKDRQHEILLQDSELVLTRGRLEIEAITKAAAPPPAQAVSSDPIAVLRAAISVARSRNDHKSARRFETALAALSPKLARTGT